MINTFSDIYSSLSFLFDDFNFQVVNEISDVNCYGYEIASFNTKNINLDLLYDRGLYAIRISTIIEPNKYYYLKDIVQIIQDDNLNNDIISEHFQIISNESFETFAHEFKKIFPLIIELFTKDNYSKTKIKFEELEIKNNLEVYKSIDKINASMTDKQKATNFREQAEQALYKKDFNQAARLYSSIKEEFRTKADLRKMNYAQNKCHKK